jgi:hypothetical protein
LGICRPAATAGSTAQIPWPIASRSCQMSFQPAGHGAAITESCRTTGRPSAVKIGGKLQGHRIILETRMSVLGREAENICSQRVFRFLTHKRHLPCTAAIALKPVSGPYQSTQLNRYDAVSRAWERTCSGVSSSPF